jgi:3-phenylpropionate/trans-cinnamate dioxygenase ferredoxin reductase subunit
MIDSVVIVGAGAAGATAAVTLREEGFDGEVVLVGDDPELPYERPPLSKELLRGEQDLEAGYIRPADSYGEQDIDVRTGTRVVRLDVSGKSVELEDGTRVPYGALILAPGVRNRRLSVPGANLPGVYDLRTAADAQAIQAAARTATRALIVGFGFIGAEVAASLRRLGLEVVVVEPLDTALPRVLGPRFGRVLEGIHRDHGVDMHFGEEIVEFRGDGRFEAATTRGGKRLEADFAVVGVGTEPNTELAQGTGIEVDGGIVVDSSLHTAVPDVLAAGDVARQDHPIFGPIRVEHFDNAEKMGPAAARALLGSAEPFADPHWFWSDQYDSTLQMSGYTTAWRDPIIRGSVEDRSFAAFQLDADGRLVAGLSLDYPRDVRRSLKLIGHVVQPDALADPEVDLRTLAGG